MVPPNVLTWYATEGGQWFKRVMRSEAGDAPDAKLTQGWMRAAGQDMRAVRYLHELGHPLLLGSDTPSAPTYGNQPGYDTYREMQMMAQSGLPLQAISC